MQSLMLGRIGRAALDLLYPPQCALCGSGGGFLCADCVASLPRADGRRCGRCWLPLTAGDCTACGEHPGRLSCLRSALRYEGEVRRLVHAFKFGGHSSLAPDIGGLLAEAMQRHALSADAIVPVPLTGARQRHRGYNQARLLAREVAALTGTPVREALRRTGHADPQAGSATAEQRRKNVEGVFEPARNAGVRGLHVLLIDDVATTGATLNACAAMLLEAGAASVSALTLARED